jgi:hypothetical protein
VGYSLESLMKWAEREEWAELFADVLDGHVTPACQEAGADPAQLDELLGGNLFGVVIQCVLEDFATRHREDGANVVDDYLKRRGFRESRRPRPTCGRSRDR